MYVILYDDGLIGFPNYDYKRVLSIAEYVLKQGSNPLAILKIKIKIK